MVRRPSPELVDLHCHLVPGVDDGVPTLEGALDWLRRFRERGIGRIVVTPHLPASWVKSEYRSRVERRFAELRAAASDEVPDLAMGLAFEVRMVEGAPVPPEDRGLWLGPGGHVLVEYGRFRVPPDPLRPFGPLLAAGRIPVLAHPERFRSDAAPADWTDRLSDAGVLLCPNGGSLLGRYGPRASARAEALLRRGAATLVASDHHGRPSRSDDLRDVAERLETWSAGEAAARVLLAENPSRIAEGRATVPVPEASPPEPDGGTRRDGAAFGSASGDRG